MILRYSNYQAMAAQLNANEGSHSFLSLPMQTQGACAKWPREGASHLKMKANMQHKIRQLKGSRVKVYLNLDTPSWPATTC